MRSAALALIAWLSVSAAAQDPGPALFEAHGCQSCHRIGNLGGNSGPDLSFVGVRHSPQWLELWLSNPQAWDAHTLMPNMYLKPQARAALVRYLSGLKGQDLAAGRPWDKLRADPIKAGKIIYLKAGCVACHGVGGSGGKPNNNVPGGLIPALRELVYTYTADELKRKIQFGSQPAKADPAGPQPMVFMPAWGQVLSNWEIDAVSAYLNTFKPTKVSKEDQSW